MNLKPVLEKMKAELEKAYEAALIGLELEAEKQIEEKSDKLVDMVAEKLKELIPGNWEDGLVEMEKAKLKPKVKAMLLDQAEKISDKV